MDSEYQIDWADSQEHGHQIICESRSDDLIEENNDIEEDEEYLVGEEIIPSTEIITISNSLDQIAAENLIYMAQDGSVANMGDLIEEQVDQVDNADYNNEQQYFECHVTEEVITDDWVQQQGEDRVEVPVYQLVGNEQNEEVLVPLPTDEYTTSRPYPCDFCSRRFRKKANLMNHMVAHKNVKPHICNLCGAKYIRKMELMNHLKVHAQVPDSNIEYMDQTDGRTDTDEQDGDDESLLTVLHTSETVGVPIRRRKVNASSTAAGARKVVKTIEAGKKVTAPRKQRYDESANTSNSYLADHIIDNDPSRPFVCQVCGVSFSREKALNAHVSLHGVDNAIECVTCNEVFWTAESLQEHQKIHADEESSGGSEYEPDEDKTASDDDDYDPEYGNYYCSICGMSFHRSELLKRHAKTHKNNYDSNRMDSSNQNHCCNVCGSTFAEALDLLAHAEIHTRNASQKCTLCGESFDRDDEIRQHIATIHEKELTNTSCRMCGKHCKDERTLMKHAWDHSKEKNHSCPKCGKSFFNKARLKRHMQSHRNKSVACNVCGENFPDGRSLMNHRHSHTNLSGRQFPCRECGKTFGSRSSQQIHMRIHTGERPYGCRFCWKAFADGGTLRKHERIHTGEKPYACPVCPRAFNQRVVLREHIRSHHSQPDPNYEDSLMPFYCTVCGNLFKTSQEIIQHLIEHSDANTVSNRQPVVGPRKYKRRRKLKPEELETFRKSKNESTGTARSASKRTSRKRGTSEQSDLYYSSSYEQQETEAAYETVRNDNEMENIEVDEPLIQRSHTVRTFVKQEMADDAQDPLYTEDYLDESPKRKSPTKKQSTLQSVITPQTLSSPSSSYSSPAQQRQPRLIHTSKKKVIVETKSGRTATRIKTIVTTNEIKRPIPPPSIPAQPAPEPENSAKRRSNRTKQATSKKLESMESMPSPTRNLTNGIPRSSRSPATANANAKFQNNLLAELSRKNTNYSPDVVSDLEEILGSPIKTHDNRGGGGGSGSGGQTSRKSVKAAQASPKKVNSTMRSDDKTSMDDEAKPATRSSKRLSGRVQPTSNADLKVRTTKTTSSPSARSNARKSASTTSTALSSPPPLPAFQAAISSEEDSQGGQDESYSSLHMEHNAVENIVMNIKQEKEVSFTMTDDNVVFTCEMCSAVFSDRAQLLVHVPVHI